MHKTGKSRTEVEFIKNKTYLVVLFCSINDK